MTIKRNTVVVTVLAVAFAVVAVVVALTIGGKTSTAASATPRCSQPSFLPGGTQPDGSVIIDPYAHEVFTPKTLSAQDARITAEQAYDRYAASMHMRGATLRSSGWEVRTGLLTFPYHADNTPVYALWHNGGGMYIGGIPVPGCPPINRPPLTRSWLFLDARTGAAIDQTSSQ